MCKTIGFTFIIFVRFRYMCFGYSIMLFLIWQRTLFAALDIVISTSINVDFSRDNIIINLRARRRTLNGRRVTLVNQLLNIAYSVIELLYKIIVFRIWHQFFA